MVPTPVSDDNQRPPPPSQVNRDGILCDGVFMPQLLKWLGSCVQVHPGAQRGARHDCPPHLRSPPKDF